MESERDTNARNSELRRELIERMRSGDGIDVEVAYEVRERGWASTHGLGVLRYDHDYDTIEQHASLSFASVWVAPRGSMG
jgi:hypothetical protein